MFRKIAEGVFILLGGTIVLVLIAPGLLSHPRFKVLLFLVGITTLIVAVIAYFFRPFPRVTKQKTK